MTLLVRVPNKYLAERRYVLKVVFEDFLGVPYRLAADNGMGTRVVRPSDGDDRQLSVADGLFRAASTNWLTPSSLPVLPLSCWELEHRDQSAAVGHSSVPVLYGNPFPNGSFCRESERHVDLSIDIFGSVFFLLTRYEEMVCGDRDEHDRFAGAYSLAHAAGFLRRPLVNEYLELLWWWLTYLWPDLRRKPREPRLLISHDVDHPLEIARLSPWQMAQTAAYYAIRRRSPTTAFTRSIQYLHTKRGHLESDPFNTFRFLMGVSERHGIRSAFYFLAGGQHPRDGTYDLRDPWIRSLLGEMRDRGHEIGLHPSYSTYLDAERTAQEFHQLKQVAAELGIEQAQWGGRQHFLRWSNPQTWQNWEDAGLDYDSTLGFADQLGFRCGVCYEFPVFNLRTGQQLQLRERPLIVMEVTGLQYLRLRMDELCAAIAALAQTTRGFNGDFTLLWHNSSVDSHQLRSCYEAVLDTVAPAC